MLGTIVNVCTILAGSTIGSIVRKGIKEEYREGLFTAMGLAVTGLGFNSALQNMPKSDYPGIRSLHSSKLCNRPYNFHIPFHQSTASGYNQPE